MQPLATFLFSRVNKLSSSNSSLHIILLKPLIIFCVFYRTLICLRCFWSVVSKTGYITPFGKINGSTTFHDLYAIFLLPALDFFANSVLLINVQFVVHYNSWSFYAILHSVRSFPHLNLYYRSDCPNYHIYQSSRWPWI